MKKNVGKIFADKFVIAAGAWSSRLIESLTKIIYPVRGHIIQYPKSDIKLDHIIYKDGIYALQRKDFSIIVGSTLENVGFSKVNLEDSVNFLNLILSFSRVVFFGLQPLKVTICQISTGLNILGSVGGAIDPS